MAPVPNFLTQEVREQVLAAGEQGMAFDLSLGVPVVPLPTAVLIRPGVMISSPVGLCTANFVYTDDAHGLLLGTAGHCTDVGDRIIAFSAPNLLSAIGTTVSRLCCGVGNDWALIDIDAAMEPFTDPTVAWLTGPCGTFTGPMPTAVPDRILKHVGHGIATGTVEFPRVSRLDSIGSTSFRAFGQSSGGDSGSAILYEPNPLTSGMIPLTGSCGSGQAFGILTHSLIADLSPIAPCYKGNQIGSLVDCAFFGTLVALVPATVVNGRALA